MTTTPVISITDEQIAEIEANCIDEKNRGHSLVIGVNQVAALISRLRAAERDAARYAWIRKEHNDGYGNTWVAVYMKNSWVSLDTAVFGEPPYTDELDLDAAIDTAMKGEPQ